MMDRYNNNHEIESIDSNYIDEDPITSFADFFSSSSDSLDNLLDGSLQVSEY